MNRSWDGKECPVCGEGTLHDSVQTERTEYRGRIFVGSRSGAFCDHCGDGVSYHDPRSEAEWKAFQQSVDEEERAELSAIRTRLGITQQQASKLTGGGHNAFSRYERGEAKPMLAVINLFRLLDRYPVLLSDFHLGVVQPTTLSVKHCYRNLVMYSLPESSTYVSTNDESARTFNLAITCAKHSFTGVTIPNTYTHHTRLSFGGSTDTPRFVLRNSGEEVRDAVP